MRLKYIQSILLLLGVARASPDPHHRDQTTEIITRVTTITVTARPNGAAQSSSAPAKPTSTILVSALPEFTSASQFESIVLNSTNTYRVQHDAAPVRYNSSLAAFANEVTKSCRMEHSGGPFGENLAIGCTDLPGCIELWGDERDEYDFGRGKFTKTTGHFTQLVWKNTTDVGCAARFCARDGGKGGGGSWYLVCEYWPRGNVGGQFTDMVARKVKGKVTLRSVASGGKERVNKPVVVGFVFSLFGFVVMMM